MIASSFIPTLCILFSTFLFCQECFSFTLSRNKFSLVTRNEIMSKSASASSSLLSMAILGDNQTNNNNNNNNGNTVSPRQLVQQGMQKFVNGNVEDSIKIFDLADASVPDGSLKPFLWQRGISYYYTDRFQEGSDQFKYDVKVNPLDVEEIVWDICCLARMHPEDSFPPSDKMSLPKGKTDRRKIMGVVYSLFRGDGATEHDLAKAGHDGSASDLFYSLFYLGLYCEIRGEESKAASYMRSAAQSSYATGFGSRDYMSSVAKVHCQLRHW